ncbi:hypothetical protein FB451DRAFT_1227359, partial [Mycena latifolia]
TTGKIYKSRDVVFEEGAPHRTKLVVPNRGSEGFNAENTFDYPEEDVSVPDDGAGGDDTPAAPAAPIPVVAPVVPPGPPVLPNAPAQPAHVPRRRATVEEVPDEDDVPVQPAVPAQPAPAVSAAHPAPANPPRRSVKRVPRPFTRHSLAAMKDSTASEARIEEAATEPGNAWANDGVSAAEDRGLPSAAAAFTDDLWIPRSYKEAMARPDLWAEAIQVESDRLRARKVWHLVTRPEGANIMKTISPRCQRLYSNPRSRLL